MVASSAFTHRFSFLTLVMLSLCERRSCGCAWSVIECELTSVSSVLFDALPCAKRLPGIAPVPGSPSPTFLCSCLVCGVVLMFVLLLSGCWFTSPGSLNMSHCDSPPLLMFATSDPLQAGMQTIGLSLSQNSKTLNSFTMTDLKR